MLGVEPDYLLYFVSQHWTPILNGAATPLVILHCLGGPWGGGCDFMEPPLVGGFEGSAPKAKNMCKIAL